MNVVASGAWRLALGGIGSGGCAAQQLRLGPSAAASPGDTGAHKQHDGFSDETSPWNLDQIQLELFCFPSRGETFPRRPMEAVDAADLSAVACDENDDRSASRIDDLTWNVALKSDDFIHNPYY